MSGRRKKKAWLKTNDGTTIESGESLKLLGFMFTERPECNSQISYLIQRASKRVFVLNYYLKFMEGNDLKKLYCALIRPFLEYSSVVYHSQISKFQSNRLGLVQKRCLKIMYGYKKSYSQLMNESGFESLKIRREKLYLRNSLRRCLRMSIILIISR